MKTYSEYTHSIRGEHTQEEIIAATSCGAINTFMRDVSEVILERQIGLPAGWILIAGERTYVYNPNPPDSLSSLKPILMGFVRVRPGDPLFPIWLYRSV